MSAPEVIAAALNSMPADPRPSELVNQDRARIALEALKAAGYAVVELPEAQPRWDGALAAWKVEQTWHGQPEEPGEVSIRRTDGRIGVNSVSMPVETPQNARNLAAALLAAADAAEAQS
ncbi:hypothetical protein [Mycolicibacterium austroafricanum]|uniref:hypothetical protein n=1 Tax=Mycolicibacterium austroafricanum TaxID=39687 RepID=UPI001ABF7337|nr:hypothetical protein [Mycolicibacterium austroafricanum]QRZ05926.1 hypothetical protein JN090_23860 [Mycolicibacterium austroafricanum]